MYAKRKTTSPAIPKLKNRHLYWLLIVSFIVLFLLWKFVSSYMVLVHRKEGGIKKSRLKPGAPAAVSNLHLDPNPYNDSDFYLPYSEDTMADDLTVVSAFFDLGRFRKGEGDDYFTPNLYRRWMKSFTHLQNPVVMFVENDMDANYFRSLRSHLSPNLTSVHIVSRDDLWAFKLQEKVKAVFERPGYPKYHPNTALPEYSCAMHAKYELMRSAIMSNVFRTKFFCWLDVGLFRGMTEGHINVKPYRLWLPAGFDSNKVAYTQVELFIRNKIVGVDMIITSNMAWVCGCFFVARAAVMSVWAQDYMKAVERYLKMNLMNTDQQILYSMVKEKLNKVQVQVYVPDGRYNNWFHLGYVCKEAGEKRLGSR